MKLVDYCQTILNINEHIKDKQTERDELIETAKELFDLSTAEFGGVYDSFYLNK